MFATTLDPMPSDTVLVERCIALDDDAWKALERCYGATVRDAIRQALAWAGRAGDDSLEDESYVAVLERLFQDGCRALRLYNAARSLRPFLARLARRVTRNELRAQRRRVGHLAPLVPDLPDATCRAFPVTAEELERFVDGLSLRLRELCRYLLDGPDCPAPAWLKEANERQWCCRLRQALRTFLNAA